MCIYSEFFFWSLIFVFLVWHFFVASASSPDRNIYFCFFVAACGCIYVLFFAWYIWVLERQDSYSYYLKKFVSAAAVETSVCYIMMIGSFNFLVDNSKLKTQNSKLAMLSEFVINF